MVPCVRTRRGPPRCTGDGTMVGPQLVARLRQETPYAMQAVRCDDAASFASPLCSIETLAYAIGSKAPAVLAEASQILAHTVARSASPEPRRDRRGDRGRLRRGAQRLLRQPHRRRGDEALPGAVAPLERAEAAPPDVTTRPAERRRSARRSPSRRGPRPLRSGTGSA